jgi:hypothetical protein
VTTAPLAATPTAGPSTAPPRRAVRTTSGLYLVEDQGKLTITDDVLDRREGDAKHAFSSAWLDPACKNHWCILPQFRRMVSPDRGGCPEHGRQVLPADDPYPRSDREYKLGEEREWFPVANRLGVASRHRSAHQLTSEQTPAIRAVREFVDDDNNSERALWLAGPTGTGKTWSMIAALRKEAVPCEGHGIALYSMGQLVRALIDSEESDEAFERCIEADVLYLDDVGSAYLKDGGVAETLFEEIICSREADEAPMFATTNLTLPRLAEVLGDRIADRIRGPWAEWIALPGASLRRKARPRAEARR